MSSTSETVARMVGSSSTTRIGRSGTGDVHLWGAWHFGSCRRRHDGRQRDEERAANAGRTLQPAPTAMLLHDTSGDVQAKAHPREAAIVDVSGAVEALEHQRLIFDGDTNAAILHTEPCLGVLWPHPDHDARVARTVFERVLDQVNQQLLNARRVNRDHDSFIGRLQLDPFTFDERGTAQATLHQRAQVELVARNAHARILEPRNVEQSDNQISQSLALIDQTL